MPGTSSLKSMMVGTALAAMAGPALAQTSNLPPPAYIPDLLPTYSEAGKCYMRVKIPAQYQSSLQTVVKREGHVSPSVQPARLATRSEAVMVKEAHVRYEVKQPTFRTVTEKIMTRPAYDDLSVVPPQFETVQETLQTSSARLVWKKGNPATLRQQGYKIHSMADGGRLGQGYRSTTQFGAQGGQRCGSMCEIWCLVEEPGESVTISRQVMKHPGRIQRTRVPARFESVSKQVVADAGGVREVPVPAQFKTVQVQDVIEPAREIHINIPDEYGQVKTRQLVSDERYEWREVRCAPGTGTIGYRGHTGRVQSGTAPVIQHARPHATMSGASRARTIAPHTLPSQNIDGNKSSAYKVDSVFYKTGSAPDYYTGTGRKPLMVIPSSQTLPPPVSQSGKVGYPPVTRHQQHRHRN